MGTELTVIGFNHATAPVSIREGVAPKLAENGRINSIIQQDCGLSDVVVLATCSRFEVYAGLDEKDIRTVTSWLAGRASSAEEDADLGSMLYVHQGAKAVAHLFRVAAGLDSWVLGETEILGQVKAAYQAACAEKTAGRAEHLTFQRALFAGKKVRTETRIVGGINSIGGAAGALARRIFADLRERRVLVFGAGAMAAATVRHLCAKGVSGVWVANRSPEKARALAGDLGGIPMSLDHGMARLAEADIAVFSTSAERFLLTGPAARELAERRGGRPLFIIDLAVPRNVDPEVSRAPGVYLYDIDDLRNVVQESLSNRSEDLLSAEAIVAAECRDCWERISNPPIASGVEENGRFRPLPLPVGGAPR
ncbi:MAG: glutamyl-tRNA reductase [Elusimicrobia bacterium]|nr:glutamyl-tRNA reductase [Elusimicrobiota bacterium]